MGCERAGYQGPCFLKVNLSVLGEKSCLVRKLDDVSEVRMTYSSTKLDSSVNVPEASAWVNGSSFHLSSVSSLSHGLSFLCVEGMEGIGVEISGGVMGLQIALELGGNRGEIRVLRLGVCGSLQALC